MKFIEGEANPIVRARLNQGISLGKLGKKLKVSAQYISNAEHGLYKEVNTELLEYTANQLNVEPKDVMDEYYNFQVKTRRRTANEIMPAMLCRMDRIGPGYELFRMWREVYWQSHLQFGNAFCVHPSTVKYYEEGARSKMPADIKIALRSVKLLEPNWTEGATSSNTVPAQKGSVHGPVFRKQMKSESAIVIPLPRQRSQEPF